MSPFRTFWRFVPRSHTASARSIYAGSLMNRAPPKPECRFFVSWNDRQPRGAIVPSQRPSRLASRPCAASSITRRSCSKARLITPSMSHAMPP